MDEAGVTHDITLAGAGYMLAAGSYRRLAGLGQVVPKGVAAGGQYRQTAWRRRRPEGVDGEAVWISEGFLPTAGGAALEIAPGVAWDTSVATAGATYGGGGELGGFQYVAVDKTIYKLLKDGSGNYNGLSAALTLTNDCRGIVAHKGKLYFAEGAQYGKWDGTTLTEGTPAADLLASYAGVLFRASGGVMQWTLDETTWRDVPFYLTVTGFLATDAGLYIGTERGLYRLTGRLKPSNPTAAPTTYDLGLRDPAGGRGRRGGLGQQLPGDAELRRRRLLLAGRLAVALERRAGRAPAGARDALRDGAGRAVPGGGATDGRGRPRALAARWRGLVAAGAGQRRGRQVRLAGWDSQLNDAHLVCWADGKRHLARWNFSTAGRTWATGHAAPHVCLPALDGGAPEVVKQWTAAGFELGAPEGPAALAGSPATWLLDASTDAGATWTPAGTLTPTALVASAAFTMNVSARRLWLRVRCTGGGPNNPALRTVWARWAAGVTATARRRWEFKVVASDQVVTLTGAGDDRDGRRIARDLAALVGAGPVTFHDLRYAATGEAATVQVIEVEEQVGRNLEPRGQEAVVRVVLEEL